MTEFGFIDRIKDLFATLPDNGFEGIGDDCAVLPVGGGESLVFTTDMLAEGVHFLRTATSARGLGRKSLAVNLSDVASMGARPIATLLSLLAARRCDRSVGRRVHAGLPGAVPRIRRNARRGRHHPFGGRHHDQRHRHRPRRRHAYQTPQRSASRRRDFHGGSARSLRGGPARHSRGPLRHPRRCHTPQSPAAGRRRPLARPAARSTCHDGYFGRAGVGHPPHHGAFRRRRRHRHRADSGRRRWRTSGPPPAPARTTSFCLRPSAQTRNVSPPTSSPGSAPRSTPSAGSRTAESWSGSKTERSAPSTGTASRITDISATADGKIAPENQQTQKPANRPDKKYSPNESATVRTGHQKPAAENRRPNKPATKPTGNRTDRPAKQTARHITSQPTFRPSTTFRPSAGRNKKNGTRTNPSPSHRPAYHLSAGISSLGSHIAPRQP